MYLVIRGCLFNILNFERKGNALQLELLCHSFELPGSRHRAGTWATSWTDSVCEEEWLCGILLGLEFWLNELAYVAVGGFNNLCSQSAWRTCYLFFTEVPLRFSDTGSHTEMCVWHLGFWGPGGRELAQGSSRHHKGLHGDASIFLPLSPSF